MTINYIPEELSKSTDELFVKLIQTGCDQSESYFSILVKRHRKALISFCFSRLQSLEDAEDVTQETFVRAYRFINSFQGRCSLKTWLVNIAANECNSFLHKRKRWAEISSPLPSFSEEYVADDIEDSDVVSEVRKILETMPMDSRDILQLRFHKEMPITNIAHTLGISLSASKMRLYRALELFEARQKQAA